VGSRLIAAVAAALAVAGTAVSVTVADSASSAPGLSTRAHRAAVAAHSHTVTTRPGAPTTPATVPTVTTPAGAAAEPAVIAAADGSTTPYDYAGITTSNGRDTYVINNVWRPVPGWNQTLYAWNPGNWYVVANMPAGNTDVLSYPCTQQYYTTAENTPAPLSDFTSISSTYAVTYSSLAAPNDAEAAYDIWTGVGSSNFTQEIMIWNSNQTTPGLPPAGTVVDNAAIDGTAYQVWSTSGKDQNAAGGTITLLSSSTSQDVNILADLLWLEAHGYIPPGSGLNQINYGWEIRSTGGRDQKFGVTGFTISSS